MKQKRLYIRYFAGLVIVTIPFVLQSQDLQQPLATQKYQTPQRSRTEKPSFLKIQYIPPALDRRSPKWRVSSGGTRNATLSAPLQVTLLSPSHVARTISAQPTLYWYLSHDTQLPAIFTIIEVDAVKPLVETKIADPATKGFHAIQLNEFGIELQHEKTYEWSISLIKNRQNLYPSSDDIVEKAFLVRISEDALAINKLSKNNTVERARLYAENGIWYESLEMVMGKDPNAIHNREILETRSELLNQVGLVNLE
jgi:Domain of Unknown Function (DUF928)